jgi:hypothetical protein
VNTGTAGQVLRILSEAYQIPAPRLETKPKEGGENALYDYDTRTILLRSRNHLKTVFHEFYHHLDNMTDGSYDSDDRDGGPTSLAWMFADRLWEKFSGSGPTN